MIGYLVQPKKDAAPSCSPSASGYEDPPPREDNVVPVMDWDVVTKMLSEKVSAANFEPVLA